MPEQGVELIFTLNIVIAFQNGAPEAFPETPGPEKNRNLIPFQFMNKAGLIHKMVIFMNNFIIICYGIGNFSGHASLHSLKKGQAPFLTQGKKRAFIPASPP
jgi:hypothetical protein